MYGTCRKCRLATIVAVMSMMLVLQSVSPAEAAGRLAALRTARSASTATNSAANVAAAALNPACAAPEPCCPAPSITYRHRGPKIGCGCEPPVPTVLVLNQPCTCCPVEISVCLPACCTGEPTVCCHRGFLGRDVVTYQWCCGFSVDVRFLHCGEIVVVTHGV